MTVLYIAGPMTGYPEFNFPAFDEAAEELRAVGYTVINPADVDRSLGFDPRSEDEYTDKNYHDAMRRDIPMVMQADGVALLPGWRASRGATLEHDIARAIGNQAMTVRAWVYAATRQRAVEVRQ